MIPTPLERAQKVFDDWVATEGASWEELVAMIAAVIAEAEAEAAAERELVLGEAAIFWSGVVLRQRMIGNIIAAREIDDAITEMQAAIRARGGEAREGVRRERC